MEWKQIFPSHQQPSMDEIADYIGGEAKELWESLMKYMDTTYKVKPKLSYSVCAGKPGWNVKFQKSGQSFGTLYPEENAFSVFIVMSYKLDPSMEAILPSLSSGIAELYRQAGDYMKLGKWMMFQIKDAAGVEDYKQLVTVKLPPKAV
jgi:hypothetical protein